MIIRRDRLGILIALLMAALLAFAACGGGGDDDDDGSNGGEEPAGITSVDDLPAGARVGVQSGTTGAFYAEETLTDAEIVQFEKSPELYTQLQAGQLDAVFNDLPTTQDAIENAPGLEIVQEIDTGEQYAVAVAKDNPDLKKAFDEALQSIFDDGTYVQIFQKYFPGADLPDYAKEGDGGGDVQIDIGNAKLVKDGRLTVGSDIPYPPFEFEEGGELTGFDVEVTQEVAARIGVENTKDDWISTDFGTIFQQLQSGTSFDVVVAAVTGYAPEDQPAAETVADREKLVDFTIPYYPALQALTVNTAAE